MLEYASAFEPAPLRASRARNDLRGFVRHPQVGVVELHDPLAVHRAIANRVEDEVTDLRGGVDPDAPLARAGARVAVWEDGALRYEWAGRSGCGGNL